MKLVSIIVPVYNAERYLKRCIQSLLNQTYEKVEIILVDDGSKDNSLRICDEYASSEKRIKVIHKKNGGVSSARNAGLNIAKGEYIQFVDSDDWTESDFTSSLVSTMEKEKADLVISGAVFVKNENVIRKKLKPQIFEDIEEWAKVFGELYRNYFLNSVWNKLFLANKIHNRFPEDISLGEDCFFVLRYLKQISRIALTDATGYCYYLETESSLTKQYNDNELQIAKLLYQETKKYSIEVFGDFIGENSIKYVFLQDLRRYLFFNYTRNDWTIKEKISCIKELSQDSILREGVTAAKECSINQKILFWLLAHNRINLLLLFLKIGWRR